MREIEIDPDIPFVRRVAQLLYDVAAERRLHNRVSQVALFDGRPARCRPVGAALHAGPGVEHGEAFAMLGCESEHLHAAIRKERHPRIGIESARVPGLVKLIYHFSDHGQD
jgi:hypothetical protein